MREHDVKAPDVERSLNEPVFDPSLKNLSDPTILMQKLQQQEALAKVQETKISLQDTVGNLSVGVDAEEDDFVDIDVDPEELEKKVQTTIKDDHIRKLEAELAELRSSLRTTPSTSLNTPRRPSGNPYTDPLTGDETWYVQNISNGHVVISDIPMDAIKRGQTVDLLELSSLEDIKKSRDIRRALSSNTHGKTLLKRLTPEEYDDVLLRQEETTKKIAIYKQNAAIRAASGEMKDQIKSKVRGVVLSKLEKLRLGVESDTPALGITPVEFISWAENAALTVAELNYILGSTTDREVRSHALSLKVRAEKK